MDLASFDLPVVRRRRDRLRSRWVAGLTALATAAGLGFVSAAVVPDTAAAAPRCDRYAQVPVNGGQFFVQNNRWNDAAPDGQCIDAVDSGFTLTAAPGAVPTNAAPKGYPAIVAGCHYGTCSSGTGLPVQARDVGSMRTAASITTAPGTWNASYDIWFNSTPSSGGQNDGTELMIWLNKRGVIQPSGKLTTRVQVAGKSYSVWIGRSGSGTKWNVISFVADTQVTSIDVPVDAFVKQSIALGQTQPEWYLTSVQLGFEPWIDGAGLAVSGFSYSRGTPPGGSTPTPTPTTPAPTPTTPTPTTPPTTPGPTPTAGPITGTVVNTGSGRCLQAPATETAAAFIGNCSTSPEQQWEQAGSAIRSRASGRCLTANGTANGSPVGLANCVGSAAQQWSPRTDRSVVNIGSGRCLDVAKNATTAGSPVQVWDCGGGKPNQSWARGGTPG